VTTDEDRVDLEGWIVMRSWRYCGEECWRSLYIVVMQFYIQRMNHESMESLRKGKANKNNNEDVKGMRNMPVPRGRSLDLHCTGWPNKNNL